MKKPDYVFEASWEVCNKVGGIHTVLSSLAPTLQSLIGKDKLVFLGPDFNTTEFIEDKTLMPDWRAALKDEELKARIGRWNIATKPLAIVVDVHQFMGQKNEIYGNMWKKFGVDSLHSYGDYDDSSMWAYACGRVVDAIVDNCFDSDAKVVVQAHEWQSAMALLCLKERSAHRELGTVFTTHATTVGRSICDNDKCLYKYFDQYNGDVMAHELNVEAKHSAEKAAAIHADCFTTVSETTNRECKTLLGKPADMILPNGFSIGNLPNERMIEATRLSIRNKILTVAGALYGMKFNDQDTIIVSTSGRNDYKPKGYDVYLEAMKRLQAEGSLKKDVIVLMEVPCWVAGPRKDLLRRLDKNAGVVAGPLDRPFITHDLYNFDYDRIVNTIRSLGLDRSGIEGMVHVVLVPSYLNGNDGVFNEKYYDMLAACDITAYPSYYEPWGYTPLESVSYRVPTITTNLAGFGCWATETLGKQPTIDDGVAVVERNDDNYFDAAENVKNIIGNFAEKSIDARDSIGKKAFALAQKADWKLFVKNYLKAFEFALGKKYSNNHQ